jgi:hypothetical protein
LLKTRVIAAVYPSFVHSLDPQIRGNEIVPDTCLLFDSHAAKLPRFAEKRNVRPEHKQEHHFTVKGPKMSNAPNPPDDSTKDVAASSDEKIEERAHNLGCGLAFVLVGLGLIAQRLGWVPEGDWIWPVALVGIGVGDLYKAFRK